MTVNFYKYQGTGNDFVMIDNRKYGLDLNQKMIEELCNRRFGIGADGLIYLQEKSGYDLEMVYFNSDGNKSSMCGNGGRCLIQFAYYLRIISSHCKFWGTDGEHEGEILDNNIVSLKMKDVSGIENYQNDFILNTGSPHYVQFVSSAAEIKIVEEARKIRYSERFAQEGINVNFVQRKSENEILVRTYERGVEDETLSCGTGVTASAIAFASKSRMRINEVKIETPGGYLNVKFETDGSLYKNVFLIGAAEKVFEGTIEI